MPQDDYSAARDTLHRLRGGDLAEVGNTLSERLLHTHVAQHEGLPGLLRLALHRYGTEVIQCVILTGVRQPVVVPPPWRDHIASELPYAVPPLGDARFPGLDAVVDDLLASAAGKRIEEID